MSQGGFSGSVCIFVPAWELCRAWVEPGVGFALCVPGQVQVRGEHGSLRIESNPSVTFCYSKYLEIITKFMPKLCWVECCSVRTRQDAFINRTI